MVVFGGFSKQKNPRYFNDMWILDSATDKWTQPRASTMAKWPNCPVPRGAHTSVIVDGTMFVFGGYGGTNYSRHDFNDLHKLDLESSEWTEIETKVFLFCFS